MVSLENIEFITHGLQPLVINSIFLLVITITTRDIFQYFLTAIKDSLNRSSQCLYFLCRSKQQTADQNKTKSNYQTGYETLNLITGFLGFLPQKWGFFQIQKKPKEVLVFLDTLFCLPKHVRSKYVYN